MASSTTTTFSTKAPATTITSAKTTKAPKTKASTPRLISWLRTTYSKVRSQYTSKISSSSTFTSSKESTHRRIHNEIFGWTDESFESMSIGTASSSRLSSLSSASQQSFDSIMREKGYHLY